MRMFLQNPFYNFLHVNGNCGKWKSWSHYALNGLICILNNIYIYIYIYIYILSLFWEEEDTDRKEEPEADAYEGNQWGQPGAMAPAFLLLLRRMA